MLSTWTLRRAIVLNVIIATCFAAGPAFATAKAQPDPCALQTSRQQQCRPGDDRSGGEASVPPGTRVRESDLPFTGGAIPPWLYPLVVAGGLFVLCLGVGLVTKVNEAKDEDGINTEWARRSQATPRQLEIGSHDDRASTPQGSPSATQAREREELASVAWSDPNLTRLAHAWSAVGARHDTPLVRRTREPHAEAFSQQQDMTQVSIQSRDSGS
jgi:hypothetical protein